MPILKSRTHVIAAVTLVLAAIWGYYYYAWQQIPEKVTASTSTIDKVDTIRFTFKVGLLTQRGSNLYLKALYLNDQGLYYEAVDNFEAAIAFLNIAHTQDPVYQEKVLPALEEIIHLLQLHQLNIESVALSRVESLSTEIFHVSENREREVWGEVQEDYVNFRINEFKVIKLYQAVAMAATVLLVLVLSQIRYLRTLLKDIKVKEFELSQLAYYDPLTGTPNRKLLEIELDAELTKAKRQNRNCFIAITDIDEFKKINDLLGHSAGDDVLVETAKRLKQILRQGDTVGRLGGDEFLLIFSEPFNQDGLLLLTERIQQAFLQPFFIHDREFSLSSSMGIARYACHDGTDVNAQTLMKHADIAMNKAKFEGKNRFHIYDKQLSEQLEKEHNLETEIKKAILEDQFELYYQPQVSTQSGKITGAEALVRWNHPTSGFLTPASFIEVIEKGIHTKAFGEWVIRAALKQQQAWQKQGVSIPLSVNLSAKHVLASDFLSSLKQLAEEIDADLSNIQFEITEYELITNKSQAFENLHQLVDEGFTLYLDDFGTGYSSISYLEQLPISGIKIDKSFIDYINDHNQKKLLVTGILTIARAIGIKVVAEGVESQEQAEYLSVIQCNTLQGYFISKPLPAEDFSRFIQQYKPEKYC